MRSETFETVCSFDPEIDKSKIDRETFAKHCNERNNLDELRHAFSEKGPTIFVVREIPRAVMRNYVQRGVSEQDKHVRAFQCGVQTAKNVYQANGTRIGEVSGTETQNIGGVQLDVWREKDLDLFSIFEVEEIGAVAYAHSFFPRRIGNCFALPPTSHRMLVEAAADFRRVESSRTSQGSLNEGQ